LREIQRQQQIKESLYLYLLQKREETAITQALTIPNSKVIDYAFCEAASFNPTKKSVFLISGFVGFILPFIFFFIKFKFDKSIQSINEFEKYNIPVLAEIPKGEKNITIFKSNENSSLAESFRMLRTNLEFLLGLNDHVSQTILITSTLPNEGKSFVSLNLAKSISLLGKKVIVVEMDLRAPTLNNYLNIEKKQGVSDFIVNKNAVLQEIINHSENFDIIFSGKTPTNPSELLTHNRVEILLKELQSHYDYIIFDTPPVGLVADAFILNKYADLSLYIVKNNFLDRKYLSSINRFKTENKLNKLHVVFNQSDTDSSVRYNKYYRPKS
jgi:tyrosine-protein kinase Etk/Wzc